LKRGNEYVREQQCEEDESDDHDDESDPTSPSVPSRVAVAVDITAVGAANHQRVSISSCAKKHVALKLTVKDGGLRRGKVRGSLLVLGLSLH
jgi:hypothetical protein